MKEASQQGYSRADVSRMLAISVQQLTGWQRQGLIPAADRYFFSDLIALRALQRLRESGVPARRILQALESLKKKLSHVDQPLSQLKIVSNGKTIEVLVAGSKMEATTGQLLFDFDVSDIENNVKAFHAAPPKVSRLELERQAEDWFHRGLDLEERGAPMNEAVEAYRKAIDLNPNAAGALVNLGTIYYHLRRFREARAAYEKAIAVDPNYPLAQFNMGNLCDECGQLEVAREYYQAALKLDPNYADAHYNMALLCERQGDYMRATRHWKAYLKVDPMSSWASIARRQLEKLREITVVSGRPESGT